MQDSRLKAHHERHFSYPGKPIFNRGDLVQAGSSTVPAKTVAIPVQGPAWSIDKPLPVVPKQQRYSAYMPQHVLEKVVPGVQPALPAMHLTAAGAKKSNLTPSAYKGFTPSTLDVFADTTAKDSATAKATTTGANACPCCICAAAPKQQYFVVSRTAALVYDGLFSQPLTAKDFWGTSAEVLCSTWKVDGRAQFRLVRAMPVPDAPVYTLQAQFPEQDTVVAFVTPTAKGGYHAVPVDDATLAVWVDRGIKAAASMSSKPKKGSGSMSSSGERSDWSSLQKTPDSGISVNTIDFRRSVPDRKPIPTPLKIQKSSLSPPEQRLQSKRVSGCASFFYNKLPFRSFEDPRTAPQPPVRTRDRNNSFAFVLGQTTAASPKLTVAERRRSKMQ